LFKVANIKGDLIPLEVNEKNKNNAYMFDPNKLPDNIYFVKRKKDELNPKKQTKTRSPSPKVPKIEEKKEVSSDYDFSKSQPMVLQSPTEVNKNVINTSEVVVNKNMSVDSETLTFKIPSPKETTVFPHSVNKKTIIISPEDIPPAHNGVFTTSGTHSTKMGTNLYSTPIFIPPAPYEDEEEEENDDNEKILKNSTNFTKHPHDALFQSYFPISSSPSLFTSVRIPTYK
jgi:hypothetical protein